MNDGERTTLDLYKMMKDSLDEDGPGNADPSTLKYFLYARKSTLGEDRQERSIPDQIKECMERVVAPKGLKIVQVIKEEKSAKHSDTRGDFRKMIKEIIAGKANGIIAWHPDRLSRNMKEAGEIIDLLDKNIIKDLQFATGNFENSPTGKMMLGMSFVMSKQYSEHLSESVTRGNKRSTERGRFLGKLKHGYYISEDDRRLIPDEENFLIVKQIFEKRANGVTQLEIAKWLNTTNYMVRRFGGHPERYKWDKDAVSKVLRDPTYAGVLKYGKHIVHLPDHYDFEPVITVEDFMRLNKVSNLASSRLLSSMTVKNRRTTKAILLRGIVNCGYCDKPFASSITSKKLKGGTKYYYYYKCETMTCSFRNKGIRAGLILTMVRDFFQTYHFTTKSNYQTHVGRVKEANRKKALNINSKIASLVKTIDLKTQTYENTKKTIADNPALSRHYDLDKMADELENLDSQLNKYMRRRKALDASIPTYEKYLELLGNASVTVPQMHDIELLDKTVKFFFSNFSVKAEGKGKERGWDIAYKLKEPWDGFLKSNDFEYGRGERTQTFDLPVPNRARYQLRHTPMVFYTRPIIYHFATDGNRDNYAIVERHEARGVSTNYTTV